MQIKGRGWNIKIYYGKNKHKWMRALLACLLFIFLTEWEIMITTKNVSFYVKLVII